MGDVRLYTLQLPRIIRVKSGNNLTDALRFGIRTAEENTEARADKDVYKRQALFRLRIGRANQHIKR